MTDVMRAVLVEGGQLRVRTDYPVPEPGEGEVLVRVVRAGICDTDVQIVRGYMGFEGVLGHEFVGIPQSGEHAGQLVACEINCSCGRCDFCKGGLRNHCPHRTVIGIAGRDGAFADYVAVPEVNLHPIPEGIHPEHAVFVEPLAAAFQIVRQTAVSSATRCLVLGDGKLAYLVAQVLKLHGAQVVVLGKHPNKLSLFEKRGIQAELAQEHRPRPEFDLAVECTGSAQGLAAAVPFVRPRGTIVLKTTVADPVQLDLAPVVIHELTLVGSRCGPFPPAIEALRSGAVEVETFIEAVYSLPAAAAAFEHATQSGARKILLAVDETVPSLLRVRTA